MANPFEGNPHLVTLPALITDVKLNIRKEWYIQHVYNAGQLVMSILSSGSSSLANDNCYIIEDVTEELPSPLREKGRQFYHLERPVKSLSYIGMGNIAMVVTPDVDFFIKNGQVSDFVIFEQSRPKT